MQTITAPTASPTQPEGVVGRSATHPNKERKMRIKTLTATRRFITIAAAISAAAAATAVTAAPASAAAGPVTTTGTVTTGTCETQANMTVGCAEDSFSDWERTNLTAPYTYMTPCRKIVTGFGMYFVPSTWERAQREYIRVEYFVRADDAVWARTILATDADCNGTFDQKTATDTGWVAKDTSRKVTATVTGTSEYASATIKGTFNNKPMPSYVLDGPLVKPLP